MRKAVSTIMATLLMISAAVSLSIIIFEWSQVFLANSMQASGSVNARSSAVLSAVAIESVSVNNITKAMMITVRNIGLVPLHIDSIVVQNNHGFFSRNLVTNCVLVKGDACSLFVYNLNLRYRDYYTIKVFTLEGASDMRTLFVDI